MKTANVVRMKDRLLIYPESKTVAGLWIATEPYCAFPLDAGASAIGQAVLSALSSSLDPVPDPSDWSSQCVPRLTAAGVQSERAFQMSSSLVSVQNDGSRFIVQPHLNGGTAGDNKGFHPMQTGQITISVDSTPETIGSAVDTALASCRTA